MLDNWDKATLNQHIEATAFELMLDAYVIEKDYYVTKLLHAISAFKNDYFQLLFQGGTCLAKAHQLVPRMSEDCDFRMTLKEGLSSLSRNLQRKLLREFRYEILKILENASFELDRSNMRVRDEGRFFNIRIQYESVYSHVDTIKPFLSVDFFLGDVRTPTSQLPITTLIQKTFENRYLHPSKTLHCISILETAAEKWVGLTRRIATIQYRKYYNDPSLVRHIYDLYKIQKYSPLDEKFFVLVCDILHFEIQKFPEHNDLYSQNPLQEIERSFDVLREDAWRLNWQRFAGAMVFEQKPPCYEEAFEAFFSLSRACLTYLSCHFS